MDKNNKKPRKTKDKRKFTIKQQKLIDCYDGDIKKAAEQANMSYGYARQLLTKSNMLEVIRNRQDTEERPKNIADRQTRQQFWTKVMMDENEYMRDRLKASELLGKSEADFTDKHLFPVDDDKVPTLTPEELDSVKEAVQVYKLTLANSNKEG